MLPQGGQGETLSPVQRAPARAAERLLARQAHEFSVLVLTLDARLHRFRLVVVLVLVLALLLVLGRGTTITTAAIRHRVLPRRRQEILQRFPDTPSAEQGTTGYEHTRSSRGQGEREIEGEGGSTLLSLHPCNSRDAFDPLLYFGWVL